MVFLKNNNNKSFELRLINNLPSVRFVISVCFSSSARFTTSKLVPDVFEMIDYQLISYHHKISVFRLVIYLQQIVWVKEYYYFHHIQAKVEGSNYQNIRSN